jgi:nucleoside-diphosphate-sugar epimerase
MGTPVLALLRTDVLPAARWDGLEYRARDLEHTTSLTDVLHRDDVLVHLAARVHVMRDHRKDAAWVYQAANVEPTRMICRSAAESGVRRVVYLSSAKVFGEGRERPYSVNDLPAPADAYAQSKLDAERVVREACDSSGIEWTILRPPFVYGPGGKGNFPRLVALARLSNVIPLPLGSIRNRRSIVFVGNLVDAIRHAVLDERARNRIMLPTDAADVSTPELLRAIAVANDGSARLFPFPRAILRGAAHLIGRSAEMERLTESLRLDAGYLRKELGWSPPFALSEALALSLADGTAR